MIWSWRLQLMGHALIAVCLALLLAPRTTEPAVPAPFTTSADMLLITVAIAETTPPRIIDVTPLRAGRLTLPEPGPYRLTLYDAAGQQVYTVSFAARFAVPGWHGHVPNSLELSFIVPARHVASAMVEGPTGTDQWRGNP